ncbi:MAG: hypothetical protein M1823_004597 [Watsoniomyces obsoletus]|nr:MAG: hypothetical protein M1823_004597 [Watsoniomyces obsoletus]
MSEYWKSTPKYWCKHCKTYVRDTKIERTQHEATGRHQGNLKRFLRDLHRGQEREGREKERAKAEVERLNGVVAGQGSSTSGAAGGTTSKRDSLRTLAPPPPRKVTPEERKRQMAQLAEMGVAVPEEFRGDLALAGQWQVVAEHRIKSQEEEEEDKKNFRNSRDRKRKVGNEESESEEEEEPRRRKAWGSSIKTYPGGQFPEDDLDALLGSTKTIQRPDMSESHDQEQLLLNQKDAAGGESVASEQPKDGTPTVKREPLDEVEVKTESRVETEASGVVFKKRKAKNIRSQ